MAEISPRPSSPAAQSGSSTNPNTPRSPTPDDAQVIDGTLAESNTSPKSNTSADSQHDIQPTWPKSIDVAKAKAVAVWADRRLSNLFLDIHWLPGAHKAFFKLRATVPLVDSSSRRDGGTSIYLYIYPERVRQLSVDSDPAEKMLGAETLLLRFEMDRAPALVVPNSPYDPKNKSANGVMQQCQRLAGQTSFAVYVNIPHKKLSVKRIQDLCAAATGAGLASLYAHASTTSLYQGKGGQVIEGDTLSGPADKPAAHEEAPPQYSEPPPAALTSAALGDYKGKKRRRVESNSPEPTEPPSLKAMQALLDSSISSLKQHFDERLESHKKDVAELLDKTEARILNMLRSDLDQRYDGVEEAMLERVHREIVEVEDSVMRNLTEAPLTATITFPHHPWY